MTKPVVLLAGLALAILFTAAPVAGHGAPVARSIDTRVLADDDGAILFGGCLPEVGCQAEGVDLLTLDMREAADALGRPMVVFRFVLQTEMASLAGTTLELGFTAGGEAKAVTVALADANATSPDAVRVEGPVAVGDGHPKAVDAWFHSQTLGLAPGDAITGITVTSTAGEEGASDLMPGTWTLRGQETPFVPAEPEPAVPAAPAAGSYTMAGPARLVNATAPATPAMVHHGGVTAKVLVQNAIDLPQLATLRLEATGANATLASAILNLPDTTAREVAVTIQSAEHGATLFLVVATDLGGHVRVPIPLMVEETHHATTAPTTQASDTEAAPVLAPGLTLAVLALAAVARRR